MDHFDISRFSLSDSTPNAEPTSEKAQSRVAERSTETKEYNLVLRERQRIARELHDLLNSSVLTLLYQIRDIRRLACSNPEKVMRELMIAEQIVEQGITSIRAAITQSRSPIVNGRMFIRSIFQIENKLSTSGRIFPIVKINPDIADINSDKLDDLIHVVNELVRNAELHSKAEELYITVDLIEERCKKYITLLIADNGLGFDLNASRLGHYGLIGVREQVEEVGGEMRIDTVRGSGTRVFIRLPAQGFIAAKH
jgi:NarL family two-component system sensor histidine kinase LiaS